MIATLPKTLVTLIPVAHGANPLPSNLAARLLMMLELSHPASLHVIRFLRKSLKKNLLLSNQSLKTSLRFLEATLPATATPLKIHVTPMPVALGANPLQ